MLPRIPDLLALMCDHLPAERGLMSHMRVFTSSYNRIETSRLPLAFPSARRGGHAWGRRQLEIVVVVEFVRPQGTMMKHPGLLHSTMCGDYKKLQSPPMLYRVHMCQFVHVLCLLCIIYSLSHASSTLPCFPTTPMLLYYNIEGMLVRQRGTVDFRSLASGRLDVSHRSQCHRQLATVPLALEIQLVVASFVQTAMRPLQP